MTDGLAVNVTDLRKAYGELVAVDGVTFSVERGETVAILGPNGAGKTTTVEVLEGFRTRTSGTVEVLGVDPDHGRSRWRERIGVVLQSSEPDPYLTVAETIELFQAYYPTHRSVGELVELVDLGAQANQRVRTLSGGQQRRLDLALALVGNPELVFLDEPTTGFDPAARREAWDVIRRLRDLGTTVVLTTHYLEEAEALASRLIVLAGGTIVAEGDPATIGGRDRVTRIAFVAPAPLDGCPLAVITADGRCSVDVVDVVPALAKLTSWAITAEVDLANLSVAPRSLEDVYLELIS